MKEFFKELLKPVIFVLKIVIFLITIGILGALFSEDEKGANLVRLNLTGVILDDAKMLEKIYKIRDNDDIKGVLLYIDSPGGAVAPSFEISGAIKSLSEKKPLIAYAGGVMASGSYLSGVWADEIYANKGATIGSIGVIMDGLNLGELADKIGIKPQVVQAGKFKEAGTFMREWSNEERESLQHLVDENYALFTNEVATARKLDLRDVDKWANARVFTAQGAQKLHLIDGVTTYEVAMKKVEELSGVSDPIWEKPSKYDEFIDEISSKTANMIFSFLQTKLR